MSGSLSVITCGSDTVWTPSSVQIPGFCMVEGDVEKARQENQADVVP